MVVGYTFFYSFSVILMEPWEEGKKNSCMQSAILNHKSKVLFAILENWSQSKHSSVGKRLNKLGYICCMEYSLLKNNELAYYMHCYEKLS